MPSHKSAGAVLRLNRQFRKDEPTEISGKKIVNCQEGKGTCPLMYRVKWKSQQGLEGKDESKWVTITRLKYFLEEVEKYELANYDGPKIENPEYRNAPIDEIIMPEQLTLNKADALLDQKRNFQANLQELNDEEFIHQPMIQTFDRPNSVVTLNLSMKQKYRQRHVSKQITQGQYAEGDKVEQVLNYIKLPKSLKYNFLVVWKTRSDGTRPHPSWVDEDAMRIVQPGFFNKMVKDKQLQTQKT